MGVSSLMPENVDSAAFCCLDDFPIKKKHKIPPFLRSCQCHVVMLDCHYTLVNIQETMENHNF